MDVDNKNDTKEGADNDEDEEEDDVRLAYQGPGIEDDRFVGFYLKRAPQTPGQTQQGGQGNKILLITIAHHGSSSSSPSSSSSSSSCSSSSSSSRTSSPPAPSPAPTISYHIWEAIIPSSAPDPYVDRYYGLQTIKYCDKTNNKGWFPQEEDDSTSSSSSSSSSSASSGASSNFKFSNEKRYFDILFQPFDAAAISSSSSSCSSGGSDDPREYIATEIENLRKGGDINPSTNTSTSTNTRLTALLPEKAQNLFLDYITEAMRTKLENQEPGPSTYIHTYIHT